MSAQEVAKLGPTAILSAVPVVVAVVMNAVLHIAYNALDVVLVLRPVFSYVLVIIKYSHNFILFSGTRKSTAPQVPVCGTSVGSSGFPASA